MNNEKTFDRLNEAANDSAKRQDEVFDRIQEIVKKNPESAKQYLQHLTQTSKWELYSRIYGKFAYITLLIIFLIVGLLVGLNKIKGASEATVLQSFIDLKPSLKLVKENDKKFSVLYTNSDTAAILGELNNFSAEANLKTTKATKGWAILKSDFNMGNVLFDIKKIEVDLKDEEYAINDDHEFGANSEFWFNVTEVKNVVKNDSIVSIVYLVKFGEGKNQKEIVWKNKPVRIKKSDFARGLVEMGRSNLLEVFDERWKKRYFVELTIGNNCKGDIYHLFGNAFAVGLK